VAGAVGHPTEIDDHRGAAYVDGRMFDIADTLEQLVEKMNGLTDQRLLDAAGIGAQIQARDLQMDNPYSKDAQVQGIRNARRDLAHRL
jgi:predicted oxidoreductase